MPLSPNASAINSDAPLATWGWSVKSGVELTNTPSLRHFALSRLPLQASLTWEIIFIAQILATFWPSSTEKFSPNLPIWPSTLPLTKGICPEIINWLPDIT